MGSHQAGNLRGLLGAGTLTTEGRPCRSGTLKKQSRSPPPLPSAGRRPPSATHNCFSFPLKHPWVLVFVKCVWGGVICRDKAPPPMPQEWESGRKEFALDRTGWLRCQQDINGEGWGLKSRSFKSGDAGGPQQSDGGGVRFSVVSQDIGARAQEPEHLTSCHFPECLQFIQFDENSRMQILEFLHKCDNYSTCSNCVGHEIPADSFLLLPRLTPTTATTVPSLISSDFFLP